MEYSFYHNSYDVDIDAITAATISSRAFLKAINMAYEEFCASKNTVDSIDADSAATVMIAEGAEEDIIVEQAEETEAQK